MIRGNRYLIRRDLAQSAVKSLPRKVMTLALDISRVPSPLVVDMGLLIRSLSKKGSDNMIKIKYFLIVILILFVAGYFFRSNIVNEKNRKIEKIEQEHQISQKKVELLQKNSMRLFDKNEVIERRYEKLKKERQKTRTIIKVETIKVNEKLYVPKKRYDDMEFDYNKVCEEFDLYKENTKKIKLNVIELNKEIKKGEANREDMKHQYESTITRLRKGWVLTFGGNMTLCIDGKVRCGVGVSFGKRIITRQ